MTQKDRRLICHIRKVHEKDHTHDAPLCLPEQQRRVADVNISMGGNSGELQVTVAEDGEQRRGDNWIPGDRPIQTESTMI